MKAGKLKHKVEIQRPTETRDAQGGVTQSYFLQVSVRAQVVPLSGRELFDSQKVDSQVSHRIIMRDISSLLAEGLQPTDRIVHRDLGFNIVQILNTGLRDKELTVLAIVDPTFEVEGLWDDEDGNLVSDTDGNNTEWI